MLELLTAFVLLVNDSMENKFIYKERGYSRNLILLPGWASDASVFDTLNVPYNYLMPVGPVRSVTIVEDVKTEVEKLELDHLSLLGYSLGGFKAVELAHVFNGDVECVILAGIRRRYKSAQIRYVKESLRKNKDVYLNLFYRSCFYDESNYKRFMQRFFSAFSASFDLDYLLGELDSLHECSLESADLRGIKKCVIYHGAEDIIAPLYEVRSLVDKTDVSLNIIDKAGHAVFLEGECFER